VLARIEKNYLGKSAKELGYADDDDFIDDDELVRIL
jgi:hypothetical protein